MGVPAGLLIDENTTLKANGDGAHRIAAIKSFAICLICSGKLNSNELHPHNIADDLRYRVFGRYGHQHVNMIGIK